MIRIFRSSRTEVSVKMMFLKISLYSQENIYVGVSLRPATSIKRDSNIGFFPWILRNFKNTNFQEHLRMAASFILM